MALKLLTYQFVDNHADSPFLSSTSSLERPKERKQLIHSTRFAQPKKRVSFARTEDVQYTNQILGRDYRDEIWYSLEDYHDLKAVMMENSLHFMFTESGNDTSSLYVRVMEKTIDACSKATRDEDEILTTSELTALQRCMEATPSRYGLEKWSVRKISTDSKIRRREITRTVIEIQNRLKAKGEESIMEECIRIRCESISRANRLFARALAQAHAAVLQKDYDKEQQSLALLQNAKTKKFADI